MGRKEQAERERKRAAASCRTLESFLPPAKRARPPTEGSERPEEEGQVLAVPAVPESDDTCTSLSSVAGGNSAESTAESISSEPVRVCSVGVTRTSSASESSVGGGTLVLDIGVIVDECRTDEDVAQRLLSLTASEKYAYLKRHRKPGDDFAFPTTFLGGCNRSFLPGWLSENSWLVYSVKLDGAFCLPCALFNGISGSIIKAKLVTAPFRTWQKKSEKFRAHETTAYHNQSLLLAADLVRKVEQPEEAITSLVDRRRAANVASNREILKSIVQAVLYCGRQCIALRGSCETLDGPGNPGNFLALLKLLAIHDKTLQEHLLSPAMRCVTYVSGRTQNEMIEVLGCHIILRDLVNELKTAKFYSILADEVTSHNVEHLAICARFVDADSQIREEFLTFIPLERITGEKIAAAILKFLDDNGIPAHDMRGQGYDGASNMSSERVGVQRRIRNVAPLATYIHCSGHCLNLVIAKSCSQPVIKCVIDRLQHCCRFFMNSPKRFAALDAVVTHNLPDVGKRKPLLDLCKTRWAERHSAYQHFYQSFVFIGETLELIGYGRHQDTYGTLFADWDPNSRSEAQQLLATITDFGFIVTFMTVYHYLSHLAGITVKLQSRSMDILEAHDLVDEVVSCYKEERRNTEDGFKKVYEQSLRLAEKLGTPESMPRTTARQQHRSNQPATSPEDYYRKSVVIPLLDHVLSTLESQFSAAAKVAASLLGLVPSVCSQREVDLSSALETYAGDLPSPDLFPMELRRWKHKFLNATDAPSSLAQAIKVCDKDHFPNIRVLLQLACTLPVTSCECERSASVLRRLRNYMRASMGGDRFSSLALLHIHYNQDVDVNEAVDIFSHLHPRRMELDSIVKP